MVPTPDDAKRCDDNTTLLVTEPILETASMIIKKTGGTRVSSFKEATTIPNCRRKTIEKGEAQAREQKSPRLTRRGLIEEVEGLMTVDE